MNNFNKISEAIKYIDKNLNDTLSVELIAEHFAFSPYYFHRLFTAVVGKSMIAYICDRRVAYACKMLNETERKVLDIAPSIIPAGELVKRFTNRLKGGSTWII